MDTSKNNTIQAVFKSAVFVRNNFFGIKSNWWASEHYREVDEFCFKVRDGIAGVIDSKNILNKQNLSKLEFLHFGL